MTKLSDEVLCTHNDFAELKYQISPFTWLGDMVKYTGDNKCFQMTALVE